MINKKITKIENFNDDNALVELSSNEVWFDMQFVEENNKLTCLSNERSIMKIQLNDDGDDDDEDDNDNCYDIYNDRENDKDNEINNNNNNISRLVKDLVNAGEFENGMLAGKCNNPNNDLLLLCIPSSSNNDSDNIINGVSLACMNYEFDSISESKNNNIDTTINYNALNNHSTKDKQT